MYSRHLFSHGGLKVALLKVVSFAPFTWVLACSMLSMAGDERKNKGRAREIPERPNNACNRDWPSDNLNQYFSGKLHLEDIKKLSPSAGMFHLHIPVIKLCENKLL